MYLIVPKILGVEQFAYWQLFIFYVSYTGLFHFGIMDGVYLRYGGERYDNLNRSLIGSQIWLMIGWLVIISVVIILYAFFNMDVPQRKFVWIGLAIYTVLHNIVLFFGFIFQATNRTKWHSISIMIEKTAFIFAVVLMFLWRPDRFEYYVVFYIIAKVLSLLYCASTGREFLLSKWVSLRETLAAGWRNIRIGFNLTLANLASTFILGSGRFVVDNAWGINSFGKFSFAVSLATFFLNFINQISIVLFPALRRLKEEEQTEIFIKVRKILTFVLCGMLLFYMPVKSVLLWWLPAYEESVRYLGILFPLCIFDGKMQMLYSTYLKVLRQERYLMKINLLAVGISMLGGIVSAYVFYSVYGILFSLVIAVIIRSVLAEQYLTVILHITFPYESYAEIVLSAFFVVSIMCLHTLPAFLCYAALYVVYLVVKRRDIYSLKRTYFL